MVAESLLGHPSQTPGATLSHEHTKEAALLWQSCHAEADHFCLCCHSDGSDSGLYVTMLSEVSCQNVFPHLWVIFHSILAFSQIDYVHLLSVSHCTLTHSKSLRIWSRLHFLMLPRWSQCIVEFESMRFQHLTEFLIKSFHHLYL